MSVKGVLLFSALTGAEKIDSLVSNKQAMTGVIWHERQANILINKVGGTAGTESKSYTVKPQKGSVAIVATEPFLLGRKHAQKFQPKN